MNNINIINCMIRDNAATDTGGGIYASSCNLNLSGVSIFNNDATFGGGLYHQTNALQNYHLNFDPDNRCSIYSNRAANGSDIFLSNHTNVHVIVDTFTVANPWSFYATNTPRSHAIINPYTFDILHTVHTEINADHYVAPWGDDDNDGLSPASPLRTIFKACYNIASDPDNPKTIHVANGYYSKTANRQFFPVSTKSYSRLIGESKEGVIWDLENQPNTICFSHFTEHAQVTNISLRNIRRAVSFVKTSNIAINDMIVENGCVDRSVFYAVDPDNASLANISIKNTHSASSLIGITVSQHIGYFNISNVELAGLTGNELVCGFDANSLGDATFHIDGLKIHGLICTDADEYNFNTIMQITPLYDNPAFRLRIELKNSAFYDNYQAKWDHMAALRALNDTTFVSNCTFAGNSGGRYPLILTGKAILNNNIFWNPELSHEVGLGYFPECGITSEVEFDNNCIRGGLSGIYNMGPGINQIIWHDNNINLDPLFEGEGSHPYRLSAFSPLIDIGTEYDLPADALDAGGNERVWDGDGDGIARIDLGAYEYQPVYAPAELTGSVVDKKCVRLLWQMPDYDRSLVGFRIYRDAELLVDINDPEARTYLDLVPDSGTYEYYVVALFGMVESAPTNTISITIFGLSNADDFQVPLANTLSISPNPFQDMAVITYQLDKNSEIELNIYNLKGQKVRRLQKEYLNKGEQILAWDGGDDAGRHTSAGVYFLQFKQDGKLVSRRKLLKY